MKLHCIVPFFLLAVTSHGAELCVGDWRMTSEQFFNSQTTQFESTCSKISGDLTISNVQAAALPFTTEVTGDVEIPSSSSIEDQFNAINFSLRNLVKVGGKIDLFASNLVHFIGLTALRELNELSIGYSSKVTKIDGLNQLQALPEGFRIQNNNALTEIDLFSLTALAGGIGGFSKISDNALLQKIRLLASNQASARSIRIEDNDVLEEIVLVGFKEISTFAMKINSVLTSIDVSQFEGTINYLEVEFATEDLWNTGSEKICSDLVPVAGGDLVNLIIKGSPDTKLKCPQGDTSSASVSAVTPLAVAIAFFSVLLLNYC